LGRNTRGFRKRSDTLSSSLPKEFPLKQLYLRLLLLTICVSTYSVAQSSNATISGQVIDPSGRVIPDAEIEILNEATGVQYTNRTNGTGIYAVSILPPGQYRVQVSKIGFKMLIKPGIVLNVQSSVALNFTLPLGATSESITVEAGSSLINTTDAAVGTVVDRKFVENIPLNGRSFQDLISMTPGVVTQSPQTSGQTTGGNGDFSVNGQRTESNYYTVDGVSANTSAGYPNGAGQAATGGTIGSSTALGTTQSLLSVDAMQEFRVESSTYSAVYGRTPGGQFSLVTRAGTNRLHGTLYDYLRNNYFDANDWFNDFYGKPEQALRQNDFGGTLGGRVWFPHLYDGRDRTFFFISYEGLRLMQPQPATLQFVPDAGLRQNAPAALQPMLNAFPLPTAGGTDYGNGFASFVQPYSLPSNIDSTGIRLDHTFSSKAATFFRFADTPSSSSTRNLSSINKISGKTLTYTFGITSQLSNSINNEFRLGYSDSESVQNSSLDNFGGAVPVNLAEEMGVGGSATPEPLFYFYIAGLGSSSISTETAINRSHQWNLVDTFALTHGHHLFKFGIDYRHIVSPLLPASPYTLAEFTSENSVLFNSADAVEVLKSVSAVPVFHETAAFAQDEWRVSHNLNLSLGLRWEVDPAPGAQDGNTAYTLLGDISNPGTLTLAPRGTALWKTAYYNFAPRLGLAWTAHNTAGWETVVRTGVGIFFDTDNQYATEGYNGLGFSGYQLYFGVSLPVTAAQTEISVAPVPPYTGSAVYAFPSHLQLPYTIQWNTAVEQAFGRAQVLTISYVGSNGRRLIYDREQNIGSVNPDFGTIYYFSTGTTSNYQALQTKFQRTVAHGLQALVSYTWSHSLDFGSTGIAFSALRGNSDFDVRNNFQGGMSWDLPGGHSYRLVNMLLDDWGLDGRLTSRSGFPVTILGNTILNPSTGSYYYSGVNLLPEKPVYLYGSQYPGGRSLNSAAFATPAGSEPGNAPRNFARGFGATQINLAARRSFPMGEQMRLQFRAEAFNLLNHPAFGYIDPLLTDKTFGQATQMLNQSLGTVSPQYQQGGPRSMQFALKLLF